LLENWLGFRVGGLGAAAHAGRFGPMDARPRRRTSASAVCAGRVRLGTAARAGIFRGRAKSSVGALRKPGIDSDPVRPAYTGARPAGLFDAGVCFRLHEMPAPPDTPACAASSKYSRDPEHLLREPSSLLSPFSFLLSKDRHGRRRKDTLPTRRRSTPGRTRRIGSRQRARRRGKDDCRRHGPRLALRRGRCKGDGRRGARHRAGHCRRCEGRCLRRRRDRQGLRPERRR
jgi:hypothetical protein